MGSNESVTLTLPLARTVEMTFPKDLTTSEANLVCIWVDQHFSPKKRKRKCGAKNLLREMRTLPTGAQFRASEAAKIFKQAFPSVKVSESTVRLRLNELVDSGDLDYIGRGVYRRP